MALETIDAASLVTEIGKIGLWLQAVGIVVFIYIAFQVVFLLLNIKRLREIDEIKKDMSRIEKKIDNLSKRKR